MSPDNTLRSEYREVAMSPALQSSPHRDLAYAVTPLMVIS